MPQDAIRDASVVLHLEVSVAEGRREDFLDFCRRAFPVYESVGGCRMALYEDPAKPGRFFETGYYAAPADYARAERALEEDPVQAALIKEWRGLLAAPPRVSVVHRRALLEPKA
ncbi:MAG: hypothetical protein FD126_215 [Elusimicrobia bacterium]|nr:MAG: hypothetical protein FD126_215 [Elusimicrobiota bacterium]